MNREIKFRAWDKEEKKYRYDIFINSVDSNGDDVGVILPSESESIEKCVFPSSRFSIEQYTGLKDINGKKIYEGDIVRSHDKHFADKKDILAIKYSVCGFVIYNPNCCKFCKNDVGCI